MSLSSALYRGAVLHRRVRPKAHRLRYRVFWTLLDLDELDALDRDNRLFSRNRFNLLSFHDRDHGDGSELSLRDFVHAQLRVAGVRGGHGAIRLLTMPRFLGYVFNPISVYFCHHADGSLAAVLYEVSSTFGQRHFYAAAADRHPPTDGILRHGCRKALYVSPFLDMAMDYSFGVAEPGERVQLSVIAADEAGPVLAASMAGERMPFGDRSILKLALTHPLLTLKVIAGIHFEALKLWRKGVPLTKRPASVDHSPTRADSRTV